MAKLYNTARERCNRTLEFPRATLEPPVSHSWTACRIARPALRIREVRAPPDRALKQSAASSRLIATSGPPVTEYDGLAR